MERNSVFEELHKEALKAPKSSGVYLWKDKDGGIIYVGKAKSLKNRLCSYFNSHKDIKTRILISRACALEYIQTKNEYEALLLENTLIKKHKPKYNINLKDGKTYPVLKLTNEKFPRIYRTRNIHDDGAKYFGPFPNISAVDIFLDLIKRNYKLRQCKRLKKRSQPCLYYHIGRCNAPCCGKTNAQEYGKEIDEICLLIDGENTAALEELEKKMKAAAAAMDFEQAARLRDGIQAIRAVSDKNIVEDMDSEARDYIAWASIGELITFSVLRMRGGKLTARDIYRAKTLKDEGEAFLEFLMSYYTGTRQTPPRIFVLSCKNYELAEEWLSKEAGAKTHIISAAEENSETELTAQMQSETWIKTESAAENKMQGEIQNNGRGTSAESLNSGNRGNRINTEIETAAESLKYEICTEKLTSAAFKAAEPEIGYLKSIYRESAAEQNYFKNRQGLTDKEIKHHAAILRMAHFNAKEDAARAFKEFGDFPAMEELQRVLNLKNIPYRIEGFDIAHIQGSFTVAGMVSFKNGNPDKKNYRIFKLKNTEGVIDDYASMREAVARRYTGLINENASLPDLILIDGGLGQVNAAKNILDALEVNVPVIGLAEKNEEIYFPHNSTPQILPRRSAALRLLQRARDEVHRFSNTRTNRLNIKEKTKLSFEKLPHVGKKNAEKLLKAFGSMEKLKTAAGEEIASAIKISQAQAEELKTAANTLH